MSNGQSTPVNDVVTEYSDNAAPSSLVQLERQVERGSFFTHTALGHNVLRLNEVESFAYGLLDVLVAKGMISTDEVAASVKNVREEMLANGEIADVGVALRTDSQEEANREPVKVDCEARWHVCHGVCCKLDFALTYDEVESGKVKWDLGRPYFIRHEDDGLCTHSDRPTGRCGVYKDRPAICRNYSCANDQRIWKDFEKMELNDEWLGQNFSDSRPRALKILMTDGACGQPSCSRGVPNDDKDPNVVGN